MQKPYYDLFTMDKKLKTCLYLHASDVNGPVPGIPALIVQVQLQEGIDGLLYEYTPHFISSRFQAVQHLVSNNAEAVSRKIIVNEGKIPPY